MISISLMLASNVRRILTKYNLSNEVTFEEQKLYMISNPLEFLSTFNDPPKFTKKVWGRIHTVTVKSIKNKKLSLNVMEEIVKLKIYLNENKWTNELKCLNYGEPCDIVDVLFEDYPKMSHPEDGF